MTDEHQLDEAETLEKPSLFGMIMNPGIQFERIRRNPKILIALIVVTILSMIGTYMMTSGIDYTNEPGFAGMDEDELALVTMVGQITAVVTSLFSPAISILVLSLVYLAVAKIAHIEDIRFKQLFSMNTYIYMISVLGVLINGLAMMLIGTGADIEVLFTSLNSVVGAEGVLGVFLNTIEVFTIWNIIISAIGLQMVAKFSKGLSWGVVIAIYLITTAVGMAGAGFATMLGV